MNLITFPTCFDFLCTYPPWKKFHAFLPNLYLVFPLLRNIKPHKNLNPSKLNTKMPVDSFHIACSHSQLWWPDGCPLTTSSYPDESEQSRAGSRCGLPKRPLAPWPPRPSSGRSQSEPASYERPTGQNGGGRWCGVSLVVPLLYSSRCKMWKEKRLVEGVLRNESAKEIWGQPWLEEHAAQSGGDWGMQLGGRNGEEAAEVGPRFRALWRWREASPAPAAATAASSSRFVQ